MAAPETVPRVRRAPPGLNTLNPFEWIDWVVEGIRAAFDWVWVLSTTPIGAAIYYGALIAQGAVDAWESLKLRSVYLVSQSTGERAAIKAGIMPYVRWGLTSTSQALSRTSNFIRQWVQPHTAGLANLGGLAFGPLGTLLSELLSFVVTLRTGTKLAPGLYSTLASATEQMAAAIESRIGGAFRLWEPSLNLAIRWCNWAFDPGGFFRVDAWVASVVQHAGDTVAGLWNSLVGPETLAETVARLNALFPLRPPGDARAAFGDGRTLALPVVQSALARFRAGQL